LKNKIIFLSIFLSLASCKSHPKNGWKTAYKANVFCSCIKNLGVKIDKDASPSINFQILEDFKVIKETDSVGKIYADSIKKRNVWYKGGDLDGYNNVVNGCLDFYNSKGLNKISKKKYRQRIK